MLLGWFGVFPTDSSRHTEIMAQLAEINDKVNILNTKMDAMNNILQKQTDMLYQIEKDQKETALDNFGKSMTLMTSAIQDIEYALGEKNIAKINQLLDEYEDVKYTDEKELYDYLEDIAVEINKMRASGSDTIGKR